VETAIKEALDRTRDTKLALPRALDNQGIAVSFCGLAVTTGRIVTRSGREVQRIVPRDPGREDRMQKVWRSLFMRPELVKFEPFCPMPNDEAHSLGHAIPQ
jgi:hypothetical protein